MKLEQHTDSGSDDSTCSLPVEGMKVTPYGWGDPLLSGAFIACVKWAASEKEVMTAFEKETGLSLNRLVGRAPITVMVDDATGFSRDLVAKWFDWVALNVWGEEENALEWFIEFHALKNAVDETLEENRHLADGDNCTLKKLKDAYAKAKNAGHGLDSENAIGDSTTPAP